MNPPIFLWLLIAVFGMVGIIECFRIGGNIYNDGRRFLGVAITVRGFSGWYFLIYLLFLGGLSA